MAHRDAFDQDWRVLGPDGVIDAKLPVRVVTHRVEVVSVGHKAGVLCTASYKSNRNVVAAKLGERVGLVAHQGNAETELARVVCAP